MKRTESNIATKIIIVTIILLCVTNILLSVILLHNARKTSKALINERMLDIVNCAAASVNGDNFKAITADKESPEFKDVYRSLAAFRDNINKEHLKYIYGVYQDGDVFRFAVDTDLVNPGDYGETAGHGDGVYEAIKGTPTVDTKPYTDEWGTFFSAYSPVRDSEGNIVGLVMVDFDATWYSSQIASDMGIIIFVCALSVLINVVSILLTTSKLRNSLSRLYTEMDILGDDISDLTDDNTTGIEAPYTNQRDGGDTLSDTILRIRALQKKIRVYISHMKSQAFSDSMTGVGNRTAFAERTEELNKKIEAGTADFAIAIFDINGLKHINDEIGHEAGDRIIIDTASALKEVFGIEHIYRIGGDEFIAIINHATVDEMEGMFERLDYSIGEINKRSDRRKAPLSVSKGTVAFRAGLDGHFNDVFKRADEAMYRDKAAFYLKTGGRRKDDHKIYMEDKYGGKKGSGEAKK